MSKILSPKAWYLVAIGAAALMADGARRLIKKRRQATESSLATNKAATISLTPAAPAKPASVRMPPVQQPMNRPVPPTQEEIIPIVDTPVASTSQPSVPDDLTAINGIGPAYARRLAEGGITTFAAVAASTPEHLRQVARATAMAKPEEWIAQSRMK